MKTTTKITTQKLVFTAMLVGLAFVLNTWVYFPAMGVAVLLILRRSGVLARMENDLNGGEPA